MTSKTGHCFALQWNMALDWAAAGSHCRSLGGHLAVVNGIDDLRSITELMSNVNVTEVWLGARQYVTDWTWVSGECV